MCRYGHQDVYRLLARDPLRNPLSDLELALFTRALEIHVEAEFEPQVDVGNQND